MSTLCFPCQVVAELTLRLSSETKLPLDCREMSATLQEEVNAVRSSLNHEELNTKHHFSLGQYSLSTQLLTFFLGQYSLISVHCTAGLPTCRSVSTRLLAQCLLPRSISTHSVLTSRGQFSRKLSTSARKSNSLRAPSDQRRGWLRSGVEPVLSRPQ